MKVELENIAKVFDEMARRYADDPFVFDGIVGNDGRPAADFGKRSAIYFAALYDEVVLGLPPCPIAATGEVGADDAAISGLDEREFGWDDWEELCAMEFDLRPLAREIRRQSQYVNRLQKEISEMIRPIERLLANSTKDDGVTDEQSS